MLSFLHANNITQQMNMVILVFMVQGADCKTIIKLSFFFWKIGVKPKA